MHVLMAAVDEAVGIQGQVEGIQNVVEYDVVEVVVVGMNVLQEGIGNDVKVGCDVKVEHYRLLLVHWLVQDYLIMK